MAEEILVQRVYDFTIRGIQSSIEDMDKLIAKIKEADETKVKFNQTLAQAVSAGDKGAVDELTNKIKALEVEIDGLRNKESALRKEVDLLNNAQKTNKAVTDDSAKSTTAVGNAASAAATKFKTLEQQIAAVSKLRQQASSPQGTGFADFEGKSLSVEKLIELEQKLTVELNLHKSIREATKGVIDQENIADAKSVTLLQQKVALLRTAIQNAPKGASVITFQGNDIEIANAQRQLQIYDLQVKATTGSQAVLNENLSVTGGSMRDLANQTLLLSEAAKQLTVSEEGVRLNLTTEQWKQYQAILGQIVPELEQLTLSEVNAGRAGEILQIQTAKNSQAILEFNRTISGRNTVVGDYTKGITDAFKQLNLGSILSKERNDVDAEIRKLVSEINVLSIQMNQAFKNGDSGAVKMKEDLAVLVRQFSDLQNKSKSLNTALSETGGVGSTLTRGLSEGFESVNRTIGRTFITYLGFQAAIQGVLSVIRIDKQLTDQFADLQRVLRTTTDETNGVIEALKNLDTRTSLTQLQSFAIIAARAGVAAENIAGVTAAIDKLQLVAGSELGDVDTAITSIVKLLNIFEGVGSVTEQSVLRLGNALITLSNQGVASGKFLVNFSERLAGIKGATNISEAAVLGMAAAFEETGQTAEIAATSIAQVINKISTNIPKFAALAGKTVEEFRKVLQQNPAEAIIQLSENLVKQGASIDEIGTKFAELGLTGVRIKTTFQDMGANADFFRKRISDATLALVEQNVILTGAKAKQETFAATVDKIGASLVKAFDNKNFINLLDSIAAVVLKFVTVLGQIPFAFVIGGFAALTAALAFFKGQSIQLALVQALSNKQSALNGIARFAERNGLISLTAAQKLKIIEDQAEIILMKQKAVDALVLTGVERQLAITTVEETVAQKGLNAAMAVSPIGIFLAALGILLPLMGAFAAKTEDAAQALSVQNQALKNNADIQNAISKVVADETGKTKASVKALIDIIRDENLSLGARKLAYNELINIAPEFTGTITDTVDSLGNEQLAITSLMSTYDDFISKIDDLARAKALFVVGEKLNAELIEKETAEQALKTEQSSKEAQNKLIDAQNAALQAKAVIKEGVAVDPTTGRAVEFAKRVQVVSPEELKKATDETKASQSLIDAFVVGRKKNIDTLSKQLEATKEALLHVNAKSAEAKRLADQQVSLQKQINAALGTVPPPPDRKLDDKAQLDDLKAQLANVEEQIRVQDKLIENLNVLNKKQKGGLTDPQLVQLHEDNLALDSLRKQKAELVKKIKEFGGAVTGLGAGSILASSYDQNTLKEIDAQRDRELTLEKIAFEQIEVMRKASFEEEVNHLSREKTVNDEFDQQKIETIQRNLQITLFLQSQASGKRLAQLKKDQADEDLAIAKLQLGQLDRQLQFNDQVQALRKKQFDEERKDEDKRFEATRARQQLVFDIIQKTPNVGFLDVAQAQREMHEQLLADTLSHYQKEIDAAVKYKQDTVGLEEQRDKAINDILRQSLDDNKNIYDAFFNDITRKFEQSLSHTQDRLNTLRERILNSNSGSVKQESLLTATDSVQKILDSAARLQEATTIFRQKELDFNLQLTRQNEVEVTKNNLEKVQSNTKSSIKEIQAAINAYNEALKNAAKTGVTITEQQLNDLHANVTDAKIQLKKAIDDLNAMYRDFSSVRGVIQSAIGNLFKNIFKGSDQDDAEAVARKTALAHLMSATIADSFATAAIVMNSYFDAEKNRIQASTKAMEDRLDTELEIRKANSQSQAEQESLDREFAQKKKDLERKAFEDNKKIQLEQAKINLGIQLSNLAVIASAPGPANLLTVGLFGQIMYGIQAALAFVRYFSNVAQIQSAQFTGAKGLVATESMNERGGVNKGRPHSQSGNKFLFRGTVYEDEIKEIRVIRTQNAPSGGKYKIEGTQEQIASAINVIGGGINFTPGANIYKLALGGILNPDSLSFSLRAPSNPSVFLNSNKESDNAALRAAIVDIANATQAIGKKVDQTSDNVDTLAWQTNTRIDQIQVHVSTREIRRVDNKDQKATSIGTL